MRRLIWALWPALATFGVAAAQPAPSQTAWVQLGADGPEIRAITTAEHCPDVQIDGQAIPMRLRAPPDDRFPVLVCELKPPKDARRAQIAGRVLPLPDHPPRSIMIFGDTGCRLKGEAVQDCNDPHVWPFAEVARLAALHKPDLVVHVGDYYYRESPCPAGRAGCAGSPYGDVWASWQAEFFTPAAPLLASSPWVMVRGNHESCSRGGLGWFRLLDAASPAQACPAQSAPMKIDLGGLNLYVLDSADTEDRSAPVDKTAAFSAQLDSLETDLSQGQGWIVTHRPVWGLAVVKGFGPLGPLEAALNATEQAAVRGRDLGGVQMIVSGHIHHFSSYTFGPDRPAQLIVGTGGDVGDPGDSASFRSGSAGIDGMTASRLTFERYGYLILEREGSDWTGAFRDLQDKVAAACSLKARSLTCTPQR
jgi:hypothetical protein